MVSLMLSAPDRLSGPLQICCSGPVQEPDALGRPRIASHTHPHTCPLFLTDSKLSTDPPEREEHVA